MTRQGAIDGAHAWLAADSILTTSGSHPVILPNPGGSLPNDAFAEGPGIKTVWVPHSYPGCCQHAPDEHLLLPVARDGVAVMAGLLWDYRSVSRSA